MSFDLRAYKALSFDIYATLIDWETGIYEALRARLGARPDSASEEEDRNVLLSLYTKHEHAIQIEQPALKYPKVLAEAYLRIANDLDLESTNDAASSFGQTIGSWPAFPDTVEAMRALGQHYKLIVLSNVDKKSFAGTLSGPLEGLVHFDAIYTAEEIGTYKPDLRNFQYLIDNAGEEFGVRKEEILHVAQSLKFDHVPAKEIGMAPGVWIERGGKKSLMGGDIDALEKEGKLALAARYLTLGDMAAAVEEAFSNK